MKKMVKNLCALGLCLALCLALAPAVLADNTVPVDTAPHQLFTAGWSTAGTYTLDYEYYEPADADANTQYPLVIWLHGYSYGSYPGDEITSSTVAMWATDEYQARFADGGAYVLVPRAPEDQGVYWSEELVPSLMGLITGFVSAHEGEIDTSRIYIGGHSLGGMMTWKLCAQYPDYFAAAFLASPYYTPTDGELAATADLPVWMVSSLYDQVSDYKTRIEDVWYRLCGSTNCLEDCRLSILGTVTTPDGMPNGNDHQSWIAVLNDMVTFSGGTYPNVVTINGAGDTVTVETPDTLIAWLNGFEREDVAVIEVTQPTVQTTTQITVQAPAQYGPPSYGYYAPQPPMTGFGGHGGWKR